jgi:hypothetical protein
MTAPDKIYLDIIEDDDIHMISPSYEDNGGVEYIRKDALLEWAKEKKQQLLEQESVNDEPSDVAAGMNAGFDMIIGKLNSM